MTHLRIHGARGSYPVAGKQFYRYGGSTSCVSLETPEGLLIVDAGTGITALGDELIQRPTLPPLTILFTHFHLDHLIGLPAFKPLFRNDATITLMADAQQTPNWSQAVTTLTTPPFWPRGLSESGATVRFQDLPEQGGAMADGLTLYGVRVAWCAVAHPQGCTSYRFQEPGRTVVFGTDREPGDARLDRAFREFCRGTDVLIHDAQYTPEEYPNRAGWGHSSWEEAAAIAAELGAKELILTSHDPSRSDAAIDALVANAKRRFPKTRAAAERMMVG